MNNKLHLNLNLGKSLISFIYTLFEN